MLCQSYEEYKYFYRFNYIFAAYIFKLSCKQIHCRQTKTELYKLTLRKLHHQILFEINTKAKVQAFLNNTTVEINKSQISSGLKTKILCHKTLENIRPWCFNQLTKTLATSPSSLAFSASFFWASTKNIFSSLSAA